MSLSGPVFLQTKLGSSPIEPHNSDERLAELLIGESVTERIDRAVEIAQPIGDVVKGCDDSARWRPKLATERYDQRQNVPRYPTERERAKNHGNSPQGFTSSVVATTLLLLQQQLLLLLLLAELMLEITVGLMRRTVSVGAVVVHRIRLLMLLLEALMMMTLL